jgi:hypothetical protein
MNDILWFLAILPLTLLIFFVVKSVLGARSRLKTVDSVAQSLSPQAGAQFIQWKTDYDKAYALGGDCREARVNKAKMLVVLATGQPISSFVSGSVPLVCQPNHIEGMPDEDLKKLIEGLEAQNPHKVSTG